MELFVIDKKEYVNKNHANKKERKCKYLGVYKCVSIKKLTWIFIMCFTKISSWSMSNT